MKTRAAQIDESALIERLQTEPPELVLNGIPSLQIRTMASTPWLTAQCECTRQRRPLLCLIIPCRSSVREAEGRVGPAFIPRSCFRLNRRRKCLSEQRMPCVESRQRASKSLRIASCWSAGSRLRNFSQSANAGATISLQPGVCQPGESVGGF